mmetsp:Transcript_73/g.188  ORF Transcript_73/g.188 Transcript_73/m.188 type:complete len:554 (-) Transcript_73:82-1743(-)
MERCSKGPRANRSKKTLPAAFFSQAVRNKSGSPAPGERDHGVAAFSSSDGVPFPNRGDAVRRQSKVAPEVDPIAGQPHWGQSWQGGGAGAGDKRESIRLDALVFLSSWSQRHGHFVMKKMLHPPALALFCLVELPVTEPQRGPLKASLQDWLRRWCAIQAEHPELLVEVCEAFWDAPQGYPMGILCEYMPQGSLDELIQSCGGLPEEAVREISRVVLEALAALHSASPPVVHGCLKPSQVLFSTTGRPKLTFGLEQRLKGCQELLFGQQAGGADGLGGAGPSGPQEQSPAVDIFDLGLLLLVSALGGLDVLLDAIPYAREFGARQGPGAPLSAVSHDTCALLQHELRADLRLGLEGDAAPPAAEVAGTGAPNMGYLPPASDLLFNRQYSRPFLAFVTTCLEAHTHSTPVTAMDLLQHDFLREQAPVGPLVSLREMQGLARFLNEAADSDPGCFGPAKNANNLLPGMAPCVAQNAQLYLLNIAQAIAPYWGVAVSSEAQPSHPHRRRREWQTLLTDTARALGLPQAVVQDALEAQVERLMQSSARGRRERDLGV